MLLFCFAAAPRADVSKYLEAFRTSCFIVKYVSGKFPGNGLLMLSGYKKNLFAAKRCVILQACTSSSRKNLQELAPSRIHA